MDGNGGTVYGYFTVNADGTLTAPELEPTKDGYIFAGWYKDAELTEQWNFATDKVTENITIYAKWTNADEPIVSSNTFTFELNEDGESYALVGVNLGTENDLVIPSTSNGKPVTAIGAQAFSNCNRVLTSLTIPRSIKVFETGAFDNCSGFENVYYIGTMADWCGIEFKSSNDTPRCHTYNVYIDNQLITDEVVIPDGVTRIGMCAFACFEELKTLVIPASVKEFGKAAFCACYYIENTYYMGDLADWCSTTFEHPFSNPSYNSKTLYINNVLIEGDLVLPDTVTEIKDYAFVRTEGITSVTIPDSVTSLGEFAFYRCKNVTTIVIGDGVQTIGDSAFWGCKNLVSLTIGSGVTYIGKVILTSSTMVAEIKYNGTVEQWNAIQKESIWASGHHGLYVICTDGEVKI